MDSELMHSIVGSYLKPPERVFVPPFTQNCELSQNHHSGNFEATSSKMLRSPISQGNINIKILLKIRGMVQSMLYKSSFFCENNLIAFLTKS